MKELKNMFSLDELKNNKGIKMYNYAKKLIPGGTQLLSKRPEMFFVQK